MDSKAFSRAKIKVVIAKLFEIAYSKDKGITAKLLRSKGKFRVTVDPNGHVMLRGAAGTLTFDGTPALQSIGAKLKFLSASFSNGEGENINYTATLSFSEAASISISGSFDPEELITACSGLLCRAARAITGESNAYEAKLKKAMRY